MSEDNIPKLRIQTDDDMSATSCLQVSVYRPLNEIEFKHMTQYGRVESLSICSGQVDKLVKFLLESKAWIESGYDPELEPEAYAENGTKFFDKMWK